MSDQNNQSGEPDFVFVTLLVLAFLAQLFGYAISKHVHSGLLVSAYYLMIAFALAWWFTSQRKR